MTTVANKIEQLLNQRDKTPYWLAKKTGVSTQSIYNIITKGVDIDDLRYKTVRLIAETLNVEIEDLRSEN